MKLGRQTVPIASLITRNWLATEMRVRVSQAKVDQYAQEKAAGAEFPPPVVFIDPKSEIMRVGDGFHRILAERLNGAKQIEINLMRGGRLDAILYGIETNREQRGLPFALGDKTKCILTLLRDPVASKWSNDRIAEVVGCAPSRVAQCAIEKGVPRPKVVIDKSGKDRPYHSPAQRRCLLNRKRAQAEARKAAREQITCPHCQGRGYIMREDAADPPLPQPGS